MENVFFFFFKIVQEFYVVQVKSQYIIHQALDLCSSVTPVIP